MTSEYNWPDWSEDEDEWGDITDSELLQAVHEAEREEHLKEARHRKKECLRRLMLKKIRVVFITLFITGTCNVAVGLCGNLPVALLLCSEALTKL